MAELSLRTTNEHQGQYERLENKGYRIEVQTSNGGINLLVPDLLYHNAMRMDRMNMHAEAETGNYAAAAQKVNIYAETTNGYIEVIK